MSIREDITIEWERSPRIIKGPSPDEVSAQDLIDTLRYLESVPQAGYDVLSYDYIVDAAGKEELSGGVSVGITLTLLNAQYEFESNVIPIETGTATLLDTNGETLIDTAATFITNGVTRGSMVINFTDLSLATVIEVISETEIKHRILASGINNDWEVGDIYKVFGVEQCALSGGNIVAVDENGFSISAVSPTAFTQILTVSASSATLQEQAAIEYTTFQNAVWVDVVNGDPISSGLDLIGNTQFPVNNIPDAVIIGGIRGFSVLQILGDINLGIGDNIPDFTIIGENPVKSKITVSSGADVLGCEFKKGLLTGILDGQSSITDCLIENLNYVEGIILRCGIRAGTLVLGGSETTRIINCWSEGCEADPAIIDMGGSGRSLLMRGAKGPVKLINKTGASDFICMDFESGHVLIDATVTAGDIRLAGVGTYINNGTANFNADGVMNPDIVSTNVWASLLTTHIVSGSMGEAIGLLWDTMGGDRKIDETANQEIFYKAGGGAEVMRFNLFDKDGNPASTKVYERVRV